MGINNVLQAHTVGAGAGQDPTDYTNSQQTNSGSVLPTPETSADADESAVALSISPERLRRWTFFGVMLADALLLAIFTALVF